MDLITADNGVSADGGLQGTLGVSLPKSLTERGFFVVVYLPPLFPFSSWAASWQKLSMRVKGPPMTWSTPKMWRRAGTNTRPCVRFVRATPNNVLMSLSPCKTGLLLQLLLLHDKRLDRWWIQTTDRYFRRVGAHDCTGRSFPRHKPRGWQWGSDERQSCCTLNLKYSSRLPCVVWWAELLLKHQTGIISLKYSYASQPYMIIIFKGILDWSPPKKIFLLIFLLKQMLDCSFHEFVKESTQSGLNTVWPLTSVNYRALCCAIKLGFLEPCVSVLCTLN